MPVLGYNVQTDAPLLRSLQEELMRKRGSFGLGYSRSTDPDPEGLRQLEIEAEIGNELQRIGSQEAAKYPQRNLSTAALYLGQHFPKYAAEHKRTSEPTLRGMLERGIVAPTFKGRVQFGAGSDIAQPLAPRMSTGYGDQMPQMYYPRIMAQGPMSSADEAQARPAMIQTPAMPMGPVSQPNNNAFMMWSGGKEGDALYDEWYWQKHPFSIRR